MISPVQRSRRKTAPGPAEEISHRAVKIRAAAMMAAPMMVTVAFMVSAPSARFEAAIFGKSGLGRDEDRSKVRADDCAARRGSLRDVLLHRVLAALLIHQNRDRPNIQRCC